MIIYSVTTALEESVEQNWLEFMKTIQIPSIMETGAFVDFRFVKVIPTDQTDVAYNLQLRCKDMPTLNNYRAFNEPELAKVEASRYQGKMASFNSVLEQLLDG